MTSAHHPVRVLVVDDDAMSRELLGILLEAEGYAVELVDSGDAALDLLAHHSPPPAVVLADVQMPGITGPRLFHGLRQLCGPHALLLAMSGSGPAGDAIRDFDGFLMKPFSMAELSAALAANEAAAEPIVPPSAPPLHGVLDLAIYTQLAASMQPHQLTQLYTMCLDDARQRIASMRQSASLPDAAAFTRQAHALKGSFGMLGASELAAMAARMEIGGPNPDAARPDSTQSGRNREKDVNPLDKFLMACDRLERMLVAQDSEDQAVRAQTRAEELS